MENSMGRIDRRIGAHRIDPPNCGVPCGGVSFQDRTKSRLPGDRIDLIVAVLEYGNSEMF
jgi:hypothetical protein